MGLRLPALLALALAASPALGQPAPGVDPATAARVEQLNRTGMERYQAGDFAAALVQFEEAQGLFPDANLVYNIGRCQEELGQTDAAIASFRALSADEAAPPELREKAATRLAPLEAAQAAQAAQAAADAARAARPAEPPPPAHDPTLSWILIGGGAAGVALGGVFVTLGLADHAELDRSRQGQGTPISADREQRLDDDGTRKKLVGGVLVGLGLAAAGAGVWLLLDDDDAQVSLVPLGTGAALTARF